MELAQEIKYLNEQNTGYVFTSRLSFISKNSIFIAYRFKKSVDEQGKTPFYAIKPYPYQEESEKESLDNEYQILQLFSHDTSFISYQSFFDLNFRNKNYRFMVMEYYEHLDLFDLCVVNKEFVGLSEEKCCIFAYEALKILKSTKDRQIVHHDIKLENFLLISEDPIKIILTDFEFAEVLTYGTAVNCVGTTYIRAPEVLNEKPHDTAADIWSLGVALYQLLFTINPFGIDSNEESCSEILNQIYTEPLENMGTVSENAWNCVSQMLEVDPDCRISVEDALRLDWFSGLNEDYIDTKAKISAIKTEASNAKKLTKTESTE